MGAIEPLEQLFPMEIKNGPKVNPPWATPTSHLDSGSWLCCGIPSLTTVSWACFVLLLSSFYAFFFFLTST